VLVVLWSPKGGSGTSVVAATLAVHLARSAPCRLLDLAGDQPAILGLPADPVTGALDWMAAGSAVPDALDRLAVDVAPDLALLPAGGRDRDVAALAGDPGREDDDAEAAAALVGALRRRPGPVVVDAGTARSAAALVLVEAADVAVVVVRGCYLALRRAVASPQLPSTSGAVLVEEPCRALGRAEVTDVLAVPVLAQVPVRPSVARVVDAGVLAARPPDVLRAPIRRLVERAGLAEPTGRSRA
jgi:hypothetical protein